MVQIYQLISGLTIQAVQIGKTTLEDYNTFFNGLTYSIFISNDNPDNILYSITINGIVHINISILDYLIRFKEDVMIIPEEIFKKYFVSISPSTSFLEKLNNDTFF